MPNVPVEFTPGTGPRFPLSASVAANVTNATPAYTTKGAASTAHTSEGTVTARAATTTVTFAGSAAFSTSQYLLLITDTSTGASVIPSGAPTKGSFTFPSTSGNVYYFFARGV